MMEESPVVKKLRIKPTHRVLLVNAPEAYARELEPLPREVQIDFTPHGEYDLVQLFVLNHEELVRDLAWVKDHLREDTIFWITYPKKSSGIPSDLGMMQSWDETTKYGLSGVSAASIDSTWTALRFKPSGLVNVSPVGKSRINDSDLSEFIDTERREVHLPPDLKSQLVLQPVAMAFFEQLSYTNKKEYVLWVLTAKQDRTRAERIVKTVEKLLEGKKNPAQK